MTEQTPPKADDNAKKVRLSHVGGISSELGGVDPEADENLMRLSGGP